MVDLQRWNPQPATPPPGLPPATPEAERLTGALTAIRDYFVQFDTDWRYVFLTESAAVALNRTRDDLLGRCVWELFPQAVGNEFHRLALEAMREQRATSFEYYSEFLGRWLENHLYPSPQGLSVFAVDISDRKRAQLEAARSLERRAQEQATLHRFTDRLHRASTLGDIHDAALDAILAALGCERASILLCDSAGVMRFSAWRGLSDRYRQAVEGHSPWQPGETDPQPVIVGDIASAGLPPVLESVVRAEGIRALAFIPLTAQGRLLGKFMVYFDRPHVLTGDELSLAQTIARQLAFGVRRKQAEQSLQESDRRKDEFLATLAHELRNPLAPIRSSLDLLQLAEGNPQLTREAREVIERQVRHLVRLVDDLLDISRISRNRLELQRQPLDLRDVLRDAIETSSPLLEVAGHRLEVGLPDSPVIVSGDPVRLTQAFANLLNNAAKYTEPGGRVQLEAAITPQGAEVCVRDSGIGIAPEMLPKIFDMFVQAEHALEHSRGGLGVGLSLVRRLVELHGGQVEARSEGPGRGSEFRVSLPLGTGTQPSAAAPKPMRARLPRRVLVADDNRDAADSLVHVLRLQGHSAEVAYDGRQAVERVRRDSPEIVLLDLGMPQLNGYDAAAEIRALGRPVRLIALTGWGQEEDRRRVREAGFDGHFVKPIDFGTLQDLLA